MIIDCISDLHGYYPQLDGGDLLIVAGDLTERDTKDELLAFHVWLSKQPYKQTIVVAGNHDNLFHEKQNYPFYSRSIYTESGVIHPNQIFYLCDSGTEFEGLKIWGSPWTRTFEGMNPKYKAFTCDTEEELAAKFALIPDDVDILVTHSPPYGMMDEVDEVTKWGTKQFNVGSKGLLEVSLKIKPKLHVFGHIHEGHGKLLMKWDHRNTWFVNASHMNAYFKPVNKPIRVQL